MKKYILSLVYFFSLILNYYFVISQSYGYMGYANNINLDKFIITSTVYCFSVSFLNLINRNTWLNYFVIFWFYIVVTPLLVYSIFNQINGVFVFLVIIQVLLFSIASLFHYKKIGIKKINVPSKIIFYFSILITLILVKTAPTFNLKSLLLSATDVYQDRLAFRYKENTIISAYIFEPIARVLLPLLMYLYFIKRKYLSLSLALTCIGFIFLSTGSLKSLLFAPALFVFRSALDNAEKFKTNLFKFYTLIFTAGTVEKVLVGTTFFSNYPVRRLLFTPSLLSDVYLSNFRPAQFFNGINLPVDMPIARYVGKYFLNSDEARASIGIQMEYWLYSGYLFPLVFFVLLFPLLMLLERLNFPKNLAFIIIPFFYYINTSFSGALLMSHGFWLLWIVPFIFRHDSAYK